MIGTVEQIVLLRAHRRQAIYELRINEDMTGAAGTTSTAKRQQFIESVVTNDLHDGVVRVGLYRAFRSVPSGHKQFWHRNSPPCMPIRAIPIARTAAALLRSRSGFRSHSRMPIPHRFIGRTFSDRSTARS